MKFRLFGMTFSAGREKIETAKDLILVRCKVVGGGRWPTRLGTNAPTELFPSVLERSDTGERFRASEYLGEDDSGSFMHPCEKKEQ